jgi:hypothetical protein
MANKNVKDVVAFWDTLTDSLGDSEGLSRGEMIAELEEEGIDVDAMVKRFKAIVEAVSQKARRQQLDLARGQRLALETKKPARLGEFLSWKKEQIIEKISELITASGPFISVSYRELEAQSPEDLAALLEDLIIAKEMEEMRNPNEN